MTGFHYLIAALIVCNIIAMIGALTRYERLATLNCGREAAKVLSQENICRALDHRWVDLGDGRGECITRELLAKLGVR